MKPGRMFAALLLRRIPPPGGQTVIALTMGTLLVASSPAVAQPLGTSTAVTVGPTPLAVAISPDGHYAFTANNGDNSMSRIDMTSSPPRVYSVGHFQGDPVAVAVSPDSQTVFLLQESGTGEIVWSALNTATLADRYDPLPLTGQNPAAVALTPNGQRAYVASAGYPLSRTPGSVKVIRTSPSGELATVDVGGNPDALVVTPDGQSVYVANAGGDDSNPGGDVKIIRTSDNKVVGTIHVGGALTGVAISPTGALAYVSGSSGVVVIDTATRKVIATVKVGGQPQGIAVTPDGRLVYVTNQLSNKVDVIDTTTNQVTTTLGPEHPLELAGPVAVAITADGHFAYVANLNAARDNLSIIPVQPVITRVTPRFLAVGAPNSVDIAGTNLAAPTSVDFGPNRASSWSCSVSSCNSETPLCVGSVHIRITTAGGTSPAAADDQFTYGLPPEVGAALPPAAAGSPYNAALVANGGVPPYRWSILSGVLPAGLSLTATTGIVSGIPTVAGRSDLTFSVADSQNPPLLATQAQSIVVQASTCHRNTAPTLLRHEHVRVRITRLRIASLRRGCVIETANEERERIAAVADATCRRLRLTVDGVIEQHGSLDQAAGGTVIERVHVRLPHGAATRLTRAKVRHGHWRISLIVPGVNLDPGPSTYLVAVHYEGGGATSPATTARRVMLEVESAGLNP